MMNSVERVIHDLHSNGSSFKERTLAVMEKSKDRYIFSTNSVDSTSRSPKTIFINTIELEEYRELPQGIWEFLEDNTIIENLRYGESNYFAIWYRKCIEDKFYLDVRHMISHYNRRILSEPHKRPTDASDRHRLSFEGIRVSPPRHSRVSEEDVLRKKFEWLQTKLDLEGLKELNEWYEELRYREEV